MKILNHLIKNLTYVIINYCFIMSHPNPYFHIYRIYVSPHFDTTPEFPSSYLLNLCILALPHPHSGSIISCHQVAFKGPLYLVTKWPFRS